MGQAAVDLVDPLQAPPPQKVAGADDLLAQMAGEEIDRLLAEAEADSAPAPSPQTADEAAMAMAFPSPAVAPPPPAPSTTSADAAPADELDALLNTLTTAREPGPDVQPASLPQAPVEPEVGVSSTEQQAPPQNDVSPVVTEQTSSAERRALDTALASEPVAAEEVDSAITAVADAMVVEPEAQPPQEAPLPWLLRPLEWLNAPFAACPDLLRELIGKAAILTAVNALALILYVHFIRRH